MSLKDLLELPEGVQRAADTIAGLDRCFLVGFGRLGPEQLQALQTVQRICSGTPLESAVTKALEALGRNEFVEQHFAALAVARAALQGAQYDALRLHAAQALGRPTANGTTAADGTAAEVAGPIQVWQESTRHWLMELALAGFSQLENQTLAPFSATLEQMQGEPRLTRLAALLTGFLNELLQAMPIASLPSVPLYRWVDLWTRAMIGCLRPPLPPTGTKVSGQLSVLGVDLHHHGYFASFDIYGLLEGAEQPRVVRTTLSSYKVDVIHGSEVWQCFGSAAAPLLRGISEHRTLKVRAMTLLPTGDLIWDGQAEVGGAFPFLETAAKWLAVGAEPAPLSPQVAATDRHPVQLAEPVYLEGYRLTEGPELGLAWDDGTQLRVAVNRLSFASELQPEHIQKSTALLGLLRFDGGHWSVQPLAVAVGGKKPSVEFTGSGALEVSSKKKGDTLATLQERASRLLRKKS